MRSMRVISSNQGPVLIPQSCPLPRPASGEVLVRVHAAGVTPTELDWYPTSHLRSGEQRTAAIPGHEFSGIIEAAGPDIGTLEVGREIFGMSDWFADGAMADYCTAPYFAIAPKPPRLTHVEAASVPISALTAWQGLFDRANLQPGERVLIHGGAGAVGVFALQLARLRGAYVYTTVSSHNAELAAALGANQIIDYRTSRFEDCVTGLDVVFDTVGGVTLAHSWDLLKPQGRMITIAANAETTTDSRVRDAFFIVEPRQKSLYAIADMLESGVLRPVVDTVVPLDRAPEAFAGRVERNGHGKLVVSVH